MGVQFAVFFLPACTIIANLILACVVLLKNPRSNINRSFSLIVLFIAFWSFSNLLSDVSAGYYEALIWNRMVYLVSAIIPIFTILFSIYFPEGGIVEGLFKRALIFMPGIILAVLSLFTDLIVKSISFAAWGTAINYGPLFILHSLYMVGYLVFAIYLMASKYYKFQGVHKVQIKYVLLGSLISITLAVLTNIFMPMFGNFQFTGFGPSFMLILVGFTTYAILRHRLMSVEIIVQKGFVYAAVAALIMAFYALAVIISETFFRQVLGYTSLFITAVAALIIAIIYQPLVLSFQVLTDRLFFRERYDYQKTLRKISHEIASVIKLEELTRLIASSFIDTMKVSEISFLLPEKEKEHFRSVSLSIPRYKKIEIDVLSPIVSWLSASKDILVRDEIEDEIARQEVLGKEGEEKLLSLKKVRDEMEMLGISVWVPIVSKEELIGIIALGNKLSGDVFTTEDIGLLSTLANQTSVALDNARLYDEMVNMKDYNEEILQSMVNGVLTVDIKGRIITFNNMAEKITGRSSSLVLGKTSREIWGDKGTIPSIIDDTLRKEKHYTNFESGIISSEKGLTPVSFSSTILYDHAGKKIGALLIISDLTEVKELEEKVRRADKLSALATMAAGMAHEIKNPLSSMKVLSQLIPLKFQDEEFRKKVIEIMPREIDRIDRIVESLLGFARATAPKYEKMRIEDVIEENIKYYTDQANSAGIKIIKEYAPLSEIMCDHDQITQVFSNLILNAIQAMPDGGELRIKTYEGKKIENILQSIVIEVSDTGHGISPQNLKKLFDPFFTTKYAGTGLGLTITHSIIDGHRGTIDVRSEPGRGTTFIVTLPVSQELI
jgi:PAS domain S-box-containing protein